MTEQEVRRYLRQMKEEDSERAFHSFYNLAEELNISTKTVDAQLQKALTRLKEALLTE